jgi:hypothetical protein
VAEGRGGVEFIDGAGARLFAELGAVGRQDKWVVQV